MPRRLWLLVICAAVLLWPGTAPAAAASDVSADEFARLVAEAATSGNTDQVAAITSIDGSPVDMATVLDGSPREQRARLYTLDRLTGAGQPSFEGDALRNQASDITSHPPFTAEVATNDGIFSRIIEFIADIFNTTGARGLGLVVIIAVAFVVGYLVLDRFATRRQATTASPSPALASVDYRSEADAAAATGDYSGALRMLFLDGAQHLERLRVVRNAATTSTATVRALAQNPRFLDRFDAVAYGGDTAMSDDVAEARRSWDALQKRLEAQ